VKSFITKQDNTLGNILEDAVNKSNKKFFLIFNDKKISYELLNEKVDRLANGFINFGISKGDHIAILMENCPEYIYTWFALSKIGAIEVPINFFHKGELLEYFINYSDAKTIILSESFESNFRDIKGNLNSIEQVISYSSTKPEFDKLEVILFSELFKNSGFNPEVKVKHNDIMAVLFTSGTTGASKGVMLTHNQMIFQSHLYCSIANFTAYDKMYQYLPLFHEAGQCGGTLAPLMANSTIVLKQKFSAHRFWNDIRKHNITITGGFEPVIRILYKMSPQVDDANHSLKTILCGHVPPDIQEEFQKRFNVKLIDAYGLTETDCCITSTYDDIKIGSCGTVHNNYFDVKLFNENDQEVPVGDEGEIVIRPLIPDIIMKGYYKMPEKTLDVFRNLWFHTGDIAYKDDEGYYYFVDRKKDMIRRAGENISSKEVERIINSHSHVKECAIVGVKNEIYGEEVKAAIVLKKGKKLDYDDLIKFCKKRMAYFMVPRHIEFLEELPKGLDSQKVIKEKLKEITAQTFDRKEDKFGE